jgi:hypothetical protein
MKRIIPILIFSILAWTQISLAQTTIMADVKVGYNEPTTVVSGEPLKSLEHTTIYFESRDEGGASLDQWTTTVPATASTGGGVIVHTEDRAIDPSTETIWIWVSASNNVGESKKTDPVVKTPVIPEVDVPDRPFNLNVTVTVTVEAGP